MIKVVITEYLGAFVVEAVCDRRQYDTEME